MAIFGTDTDCRHGDMLCLDSGASKLIRIVIEIDAIFPDCVEWGGESLEFGSMRSSGT